MFFVYHHFSCYKNILITEKPRKTARKRKIKSLEKESKENNSKKFKKSKKKVKGKENEMEPSKIDVLQKKIKEMMKQNEEQLALMQKKRNSRIQRKMKKKYQVKGVDKDFRHKINNLYSQTIEKNQRIILKIYQKNA